MAYGLLYSNNFTSHTGTEITWQLYKKDYAGASSNKTNGDVPLILERIAGTDFRDQVIGTGATLQLLSTSDKEYSDIFLAENYTYLLVVHQGDSTDELLQNRSFIAGTDSWTLVGFVWSEMGVQSPTGTTSSISQNVTFTQGVTYNILIDYSNNDASSVLRVLFNSNIVASATLTESGGRWTISYTHSAATVTAAFVVTEITTGTSIKINDISVLASGDSHTYIPIFVGFTVQDIYNEPFTKNKYISNIPFSNGLSNLANEDFEEAWGDLVGQAQILDVINTVLKKTRLYLPVYTGINIYDMDYDVSGDDPLYTKWINIEKYIGKNCKEVLEDILTPFFCNIKQFEGRWYITDVSNQPYDLDCKLYDTYNNALSTSETVNFVKQTVLTTPPANTDKRIARNNMQLEISPAIKKYDILQNYGERTNIINSNLDKDSAWNGAFLKYWDVSYFQENINGSPERSDDGVFIGGLNFLTTWANPITFNYPPGIQCPETYYMGAGYKKIRVKFSYYCIYADLTAHANNQRIYYRLYQDGGSYDWDTSLTDAPYIAIDFTDVVDNDFNKWIEFETEFYMIISPIDVGIKLYLSGLVDTVTSSALSTYGVTYKDVEVQFLTISPYTNSQTVTINKNNNKIGDKIEFNLGDVSQYAISARETFLNGLGDGENGSLTIGNWALTGETIKYGSLVDILKDKISLNRSLPTEKLRGTLIGDWDLCDIVEIAENENKRYLILEGSMDLKSSEMECTLVELYYVSGGLPLNLIKSSNTDFILSNDAGDFILASG